MSSASVLAADGWGYRIQARQFVANSAVESREVIAASAQRNCILNASAGILEWPDRYKIIDTGVAGKIRCAAGTGHIA